MATSQLTAKQMQELTPEDLSRLFLKVLQERERMTPQQLQQGIATYPWSLSGIVGMFVDEHDDLGLQSHLRYQLRQEFAGKVKQAKQLLIQKNLAYPDPTQNSDEFVRLTDNGKKADLSAPILGLTDTNGFIASVKGSGLDLDAVVEGYLRESFRAAEADLWLSATFMLGAASERLLFIVADHVDALIKNPAESAKLAKLWKAREVKEWIVGHLSNLKATYPAHKSAFIDVEDIFDTLFALYRYQRNEAGHPRETMPSFDPNVIRGMLLGFGTFQSRVNAILLTPP